MTVTIKTIFEIPLQPNPQQFPITLGGLDYELTVKWNTANSTWVLDIADTSNNPIVGGIPLVTGLDLLEQYAYLGIGGALVVQTDASFFNQPTYANLGTGSHLYFVTS
jgi:hypothetical protein